MTIDTEKGIGLEARLQRLFLAQGAYAERSLWPSAAPDRRKLATNIDVLVSEYVSGFHLTRRHAECKGGKVPLLDRILWLHGVRALLGADSSYLICPEADIDITTFARTLNIQILTLKQLEIWETSIGIDQRLWPCRSEFQNYDLARDRWRQLIRARRVDEKWFLPREALAFIEVESWLKFGYRYLNIMLRLFQSISTGYNGIIPDRELNLCYRYVFSALLVRFAQYLLSICFDVSGIPPSDTKEYLFKRLTFGDQDPSYASSLIQSTIEWVNRTLNQRGIPLPAEIEVGRLYEPPPYAEEFVQLILNLFQKSNEARYIPIAMEAIQFGDPSTESHFPRLKAAMTAGESLSAFVKGFVIRTFSVPKKLSDPIKTDLISFYQGSKIRREKKDYKGNNSQLPLKIKS